jgi:hypothetical protein
MSKNRRPIRRKIQNPKTREKIAKRNHTREINNQCLHCIYIMIQADFESQFKIEKRKKIVLSTLEKWWIEPYTKRHYSSARGVYQGVCWAMEHLEKIDKITQQERTDLVPIINQLDEEGMKFIHFWNPRHTVGKKVWKEILEIVENLKKSSQSEVEEIIELCKTVSLKDANKSLKKK